MSGEAVVTLSLTVAEAEVLMQHLEHSVRTGGVQHARSAVPLHDRVMVSLEQARAARTTPNIRVHGGDAPEGD